MGTSVSSYDEWIELYNSGSSMSVDGWSLSDGNKLDIPLSGTIAAGSHVVLERADDNSAPGTAFLIYSGTLSNSGATLTLRDANGGVIDTVVGGEDWSSVGGDNTTKETAQRTNDGWVTMGATPGSGPALTEADNQVGNDGSARFAPVRITSQTTGALPVLATQITGAEVVYVGVPAGFDVVASGLSATVLRSLQHHWNFGDGEITTSEMPSVSHVYHYPGYYMVVVESIYKNYRAIDKFMVEVKAVPLSLAVGSTTIRVQNLANYDVEVGGYVVRGEKPFTLPAHSWLTSGGTLILPIEKVGTATKLAMLTDQFGKTVAIAGPQAPLTNPAQALAPVSAPVMVRSSVPIVPPPINAEINEEQVVMADESPIVPAASNTPARPLSYLGLIGTVVVGVLGALSFGL